MNLKTAAAAVMLLFAAYASADYYEDRLKETKGYLSDIKKRLDEERRQIDKIENTKKTVALKVDNLNETLDVQSRMIAELSNESDKLRKDIQALDKETGRLNSEIAKIKDSVETSNIYLIDNIEFVNIKLLLFTKESRDTIKNMEIVENINTILMKKADEISVKSARLEAVKNEKETKSRDIEHLLRMKQRLVNEYSVEKTKLNQLVAVMEQDKESKREYIKILGRKQKDFEKKMDRIRVQLEENRKKEKADEGDATLFGRLKGKMDWPLEGEIVEFFGPKKVEGFQGTIQNKGIKVSPSKHGDVRAVFEGTVKYVDNIRGFGNLVIIGHPGAYYTLYANMSRVSVQTGGNVASGQAIGAVSVDRQAETPYLYFEIRKHNEALNPAEWLKPVRR
ncbi:MAG: murein hydrolase activator EnvC [Deferribacterales bacterium]